STLSTYKTDTHLRLHATNSKRNSGSNVTAETSIKHSEEAPTRNTTFHTSTRFITACTNDDGKSHVILSQTKDKLLQNTVLTINGVECNISVSRTERAAYQQNSGCRSEKSSRLKHNPDG